MGIRMVRQPSETPNVTNIDDIIPFRYAYGDQNGYVIGKGAEISYTIDGNTFRVNSGRVVLQGVETDIDANGVSFTIDNASETRYFVVYYEVNLATQTTAINLSNYSYSGYPTIEGGDDLTVTPNGIARLELYRFTLTNGVIDNIEKTAKAINYINSQTKVDNAVNSTKVQGVDFSQENVAKFNEYIISKKKPILSNVNIPIRSSLGYVVILENFSPYFNKKLLIEVYDKGGAMLGEYKIMLTQNSKRLHCNSQASCIKFNPNLISFTLFFVDEYNNLLASQSAYNISTGDADYNTDLTENEYIKNIYEVVE